MNISKELTLGEFAALVATWLRAEGIDTVLTGGAVVSIYTNNKYQSYDADFVSPADHQSIARVLRDKGFKQEGKNFVHPDSDFFVEFPPGPLAVGGEYITAETEIVLKGNKLKILSPTQSVMDRLAAYFHWTDRQSLDQALWIAERHPIQMEKIRKWAKAEGSEEKFDEFLQLTKHKKR